MSDNISSGNYRYFQFALSLRQHLLKTPSPASGQPTFSVMAVRCACFPSIPDHVHTSFSLCILHLFAFGRQALKGSPVLAWGHFAKPGKLVMPRRYELTVCGMKAVMVAASR